MDVARPESAVPDVLEMDVAPGTRVLVTSDLHLREVATDASTWACGELVRLLDAWEGPGVLAMAGDVIELWAGDNPRADTALDAHPDLVRAIAAFAAGPERRVLYLVGNHDGRVGWDAESIDIVVQRLGCEVTFAAEIAVQGVAGSTVRMEHGHAYDPANAFEDPRDPHSSPLGQHIVQEFLPSVSRLKAGWLEGLDTLTDPRGFPTLIASRMFYRRVVREARWFVVPFLLVLLLRIPLAYVVFNGRLERLRPFSRVLLIADIMILTVIVVGSAILLLLVRHWWKTVSTIIVEEQGAEQNASTRFAAADFIERRYAGMVCGHTHHAELSTVGAGFYANTGSGTRALDRVEARLGLPSVFLQRLQTSWVLLQAGADTGTETGTETGTATGTEAGTAHPWVVTLTMGRRNLPGSSTVERMVAKQAGALLPEPVPIGRYP